MKINANTIQMMAMHKIYFLFFVLLQFCTGCDSKADTDKKIAQQDSIINSIVNLPTDGTTPVIAVQESVEHSGNKIDSIVNFAKTLKGIPYKYASADPAAGFDCSGFITYVFNHFNIEVPRSSVDFTNVGTPINLAQAKRGDLILFTGTDSSERIVGHMGIVTENNDSLRFIHATSGKQYGVTVTTLNDYYMGRFVKVIRYL